MLVRFVAAVILALWGSCATAQTAPKQQAYVVDSSGKVIGPLYGQFSVLMQITKQTVASVAISADGFSVNDHGYYAYDSNDCTGTKYLPADFIVPTAYIIRGQTLIIYPDMTQRSFHNFNSLFGVRCYRNFPTKGYAAPAKATAFTGSGFVPPFKVVLQ